MDIDITEFFNNAEPFEYSASAAELGDNAGRITWQNACNAEFALLNKEDEKDAIDGRISGSIYGGPLSVDGRVYYSLG